MTAYFLNRQQAGLELVQHLQNKQFDVVLALPRGGVPLGVIISEKLQIPLDILLVRKLGTPYNEEFAFGAITSHGKPYYNQEIIASENIDKATIDSIQSNQQKELIRREKLYRQGKPPQAIRDKHTVIVDDGIATGATVKAALNSLKEENPASIALAIPVIPKETFKKLSPLVDELIALYQPSIFYAVGQFYQEFNQVSDEEVIQMLSS